MNAAQRRFRDVTARATVALAFPGPTSDNNAATMTATDADASFHHAFRGTTSAEPAGEKCSLQLPRIDPTRSSTRYVDVPIL